LGYSERKSGATGFYEIRLAGTPHAAVACLPQAGVWRFELSPARGFSHDAVRANTIGTKFVLGFHGFHGHR
jgi:hypothetical protein